MGKASDSFDQQSLLDNSLMLRIRNPSPQLDRKQIRPKKAVAGSQQLPIGGCGALDLD
jgi:hypothetical protein